MKPFSGPYKIIEKTSNNVYKLDLPSKKTNPKVHVRFLKPFVSGITDPTMASNSGNCGNSGNSGDGNEDQCEDRKRPPGDGDPQRDDFEGNGEEVAEYFPPISHGCWNCGSPNHDHRHCQKPRRIFCFLCGWPQVTVNGCPRPSCAEIRARNAQRGQVEASRTVVSVPRASVAPVISSTSVTPSTSASSLPGSREEPGCSGLGFRENLTVVVSGEGRIVRSPGKKPSQVQTARPCLRLVISDSTEVMRRLREALADFLQSCKLPSTSRFFDATDFTFEFEGESPRPVAKKAATEVSSGSDLGD